jgi:protein-S-isoprenylcysteine O-methyltransferase Ste14
VVPIGNFFFRFRNGLFPVVYLLLFAKAKLIFQDYRAAAVVGVTVAALGQGLRAATIGLDYIIRGGRNRQVYADKLVTGGLFSHCRNPLYVGNYVVLVGLGIASSCAVFLFIGLPLFAFAYWTITLAEENFLRRKFGVEFDAYCRQVRRYVPRLSGLGKTFQGMRFNWRRLITAEYGSAFAWVAGMCLVILHNVWLAGDYSARSPWVLVPAAMLAGGILAYATARYLKKSGRLEPKIRREPQSV